MFGIGTYVAKLLSMLDFKKSENNIGSEKIVGSLNSEPISIPTIPDNLPILSLSEKQFVSMTNIVIDNFEGGYYHPNMKRGFNTRSQKMLGDSGETLFGLDRKHGSQLAKYPEWKEFWNIVDKDKVNNKHLWRYNYRAGKLELILKELAAKIMYKWFNYLAGKYILISSMDEIANDDRLIIHFSYASWNGEGWFKRYATALNNAIQKYEGNKDLIFKEAIKARTESSNAVIRQQGANMMALFKKLKFT